MCLFYHTAKSLFSGHCKWFNLAHAGPLARGAHNPGTPWQPVDSLWISRGQGVYKIGMNGA